MSNVQTIAWRSGGISRLDINYALLDLQDLLEDIIALMRTNFIVIIRKKKTVAITFLTIYFLSMSIIRTVHA